ncbi:hypothetical protein PFLUV_G00171730, partial [Perca fluviatilis]
MSSPLSGHAQSVTDQLPGVCQSSSACRTENRWHCSPGPARDTVPVARDRRLSLHSRDSTGSRSTERQTGSGLQRQTGSGLQRDRQVQVYRETQTGSGLQRHTGSGLQRQTGSGLQRDRQVQVYRDSDRFRSTETQTGSGLQRLRQVQVYREMKLMKMMKMMKMMVVLVLVLSGLLCVSADEFHEDLAIGGCSDSDGENMYSLDGEETWYADFINKRGVDPQPSFIDHITFPGGYQQAEANQQICRANLKVDREAYKNPPLQL